MGIKQHYVPQFILKNWSEDTKNIDIYLVNQDKYVKGPLRDQAQKHYLYGSDQRIEDLFCFLENEVSTITRGLLNEIIPTEIETIIRIKMFIVTQYCRTPLFVKNMNQAITVLTREILHHSKEFENNEKAITATSISFTNPAREQIRMILEILPSILDLRLCLIRNKTTEEFVIGENPVVILNPFLIEKGWDASRKGLSLKGTVIIMPLSPSFSICLYDHMAYGFVGKSRVASASDNDVKLLNLCQFFNTESCIYTNNALADLKELSIQSEKYRKSVKSYVKTYVAKNTNRKFLLQHSSFNYPIDEEFSFLGYKSRFLQEEISFQNEMRETAKEFIDAYKKTDIYQQLHTI